MKRLKTYLEIESITNKIMERGIMVWHKSNATDFFFSNLIVVPLQNSSLGQLHTNGDVPIFGSSAGSLQPVLPSACQLHSFGCFLKSRNDVL